MKYAYLIILSVICFNCQNTPTPTQYRHTLNLEGSWQFALDTANVGTSEKWFLTDLNDNVTLPGTTDSNKKGFVNTDTTTMHLNRPFIYEGAAWYRKKVIIPENFKEQHIILYLERTKPSNVWIDSTLVGSSQLLQAPQQFDVSSFLSPGEHYITLQINNDLKLTPYGNVHIYTDDTQTNWNGVIGKMYLEASAPTYISNLQVFPNIEKKAIDVAIEVENGSDQVSLELLVENTINGVTTQLKPQQFILANKSKNTVSYVFENDIALWDEYEQPLYKVTAIISNKNTKDAQSVIFGMRNFKVDGRHFAINGRQTFLRGKHDAAVFPNIGHTPMDVESWRKIYKIAKSYGINHYRFHTYCPPEAAFTAADLEGMYLQAELPFWGGLESDTIAAQLKAEGEAMLKAYANHPSFVMFSPGNEIWSGHDNVEKLMVSLKGYDGRPMYTIGSNNNIGYVPPRDYAEFFVGARTPFDGDANKAHTRLTHAFADAKDGGILNTQTPSTNFNFDYSVSRLELPIISHEIGQYQIYPDYKEIEKYTGILKAWNLIEFKNRLEKAGMLDLDSAFQKASGAWSAICYKAEMEAALRTKDMAGFQLLDLQDFPGQGTALVGILDAFMDSKDVVTPETWKQSCNDVVLLLEFPKYTWTNSEHFTAQLDVVNYSNKAITEGVQWKVEKENGFVMNQGNVSATSISNDGLSNLGKLSFDLSNIEKPERLNVLVSIANTEYSNSYPIWVYPSKEDIEIPTSISIVEDLNTSALNNLKNGGTVLYFPKTSSIEKNSFPGHFPPEFWNYGMFKSISESNNKPVSPGTLGLLMDPKHPIFNAFPTDFHTNWQWFSMIKNSNSLILDNTANDYRPIVQVIDNLERNHKLGLIFEFKVGTGKLLVCMSQLNKIADRPEARQLYQSIVNYMESEDFHPSYEISAEELTSLFH
ncbi:sugar-binding domain-containing protein [Mangrovimonas sp. YM274]|uniref:sugar-binding domain-containing protein n=1 Tax=Mangrovimonas sp. YM274 TaxID=3070660 RepID=UPI0027DC7523|nr:sugar-binding domain-containing protein [Mangrovimonas sp. YM274]WMI69969.1 hypothetical protein RBH95_06370 [Mangrovimonas sp. YM274]